MSNKQQKDLNNKVSIITGASSGIGRSTAILFSELGSKLVLVGRNEKNLNETVDLCSTNSSNNVLKVVGDVRDEETRERIVNEALRKFNKIDILVNNAGGNIQTPRVKPKHIEIEIGLPLVRDPEAPNPPDEPDSREEVSRNLQKTKKNNSAKLREEISKPGHIEIELGLPLVKDPEAPSPPDSRETTSQEQRKTRLSSSGDRSQTSSEQHSQKSPKESSKGSNEVNSSVGNLQTLNIDDFDATMDLNVRAIISLTQKCLPEIIKQKGAIVNVSSVVSVQAIPTLLSYCVSKAALDMFTKCVALELADKGVRVNSVNPATIKTNIFKASGASEEKINMLFEHAKSWHPIGRVGEPDEVAQAIAFLASDRASFSTGIFLNVDGGRLIASPGWNFH